MSSKDGNAVKRLKLLETHVRSLNRCTQCPAMHRPVVSGAPVLSEVMMIGQAPGPKEGSFGKPFAWTAGRTLFRWFGEIGLTEEEFRKRIYMAAVCRCFPGKNPKGGDRVPDHIEIERCGKWMASEISILEPKLVIPIGKLAIRQFLQPQPILSGGKVRKTDDLKLDAVVGTMIRIEKAGQAFDVIPLPHPSGASTWHRMEPGKSLLKRSLRLIAKHPAFERIRSA